MPNRYRTNGGGARYEAAIARRCTSVRDSLPHVQPMYGGGGRGHVICWFRTRCGAAGESGPQRTAAAIPCVAHPCRPDGPRVLLRADPVPCQGRGHLTHRTLTERWRTPLSRSGRDRTRRGTLSVAAADRSAAVEAGPAVARPSGPTPMNAGRAWWLERMVAPSRRPAVVRWSDSSIRTELIRNGL